MTPLAALKQQTKLPEKCRLSVADILFKTALRHDATGEPLRDIFFEFVEKSKNELSKKAFNYCIAIWQFNHIDFCLEAKNQSSLMAIERADKIKELQNFFKSRGWIKKDIEIKVLTDSMLVKKPVYKNHHFAGYRFEKVKCTPHIANETYPFFVRKITRDGIVTDENVLDGLQEGQYMLTKAVYPVDSTTDNLEPDVYHFDTFSELTIFLFGDKK